MTHPHFMIGTSNQLQEPLQDLNYLSDKLSSVVSNFDHTN